MSGNKRQRELARAKYERQQARRSVRADRRRRNQVIIASVVVLALVVGALTWFAVARTSSDTTATPQASTAASPSAVPSTAPSASAAPSVSPEASPSPAASGWAAASEDPAAGEQGILDCSAPGTVRPDDISFDAPPADPTTATSLTLATNCGDIVIALDPKAPATIASAAFLAEQGFYDNTQCHRLTTSGIFVLQCGDPAGNGTGGPGYALPDENLPAAGEANYPAGTVAMANAGPGTGGSQFFLVYDDTTLPGDYTVFGTITQGLDIVKEVASVGTSDGGPDGAPRQPVFIESATVQAK